MNLKINRNSSVPLYLQVESLLRTLIEKPEYSEEKKFLPKEADMAKAFGISRNTVRKAISKLVYEGRLERKRGVGTQVKDKEIVTALRSWHSFTREMTEKGIPFSNLNIKCQWITADKTIAPIFNLKKGEPIQKLTRLRGDDHKNPVVLFISYFHPRIGISDTEDFSQPLYEILEKKYSVLPQTSKEKIKAITADNPYSTILKIPEKTPILYRERKVYDSNEKIIEYNRCYYRADKFTYSITITN